MNDTGYIRRNLLLRLAGWIFWEERPHPWKQIAQVVVTINLWQSI